MTTTTTTLDARETRSRKPRVARTNARPAVQKTKVTLVLDDDVATRLHVHAAMTKLDRSDLVNQLVREHLKRFVVQDRSRATCDTVTIGEELTAA